MAYSKFSYKTIRQNLKIQEEYALLFDKVMPITPQDWLLSLLEKAKRIALFSEKSRSEGIVFPILLYLEEHNQFSFSLYSGAVLVADESKGLNGECDFILSAGKQSLAIDTPLFCMIEAEDNDIERNIPQCIAQMEGARIYNQNEGKNTEIMYGCVTTGTEWQFLKLENQTCFIDDKRYYINELPTLLGVLQQIVELQLKQIAL
jgi:hypothetical protein